MQNRLLASSYISFPTVYSIIRSLSHFIIAKALYLVELKESIKNIIEYHKDHQSQQQHHTYLLGSLQECVGRLPTRDHFVRQEGNMATVKSWYWYKIQKGQPHRKHTGEVPEPFPIPSTSKYLSNADRPFHRLCGNLP